MIDLEAIKADIEAAEASGYESKDGETIETLKMDARILAAEVERLRGLCKDLIANWGKTGDFLHNAQDRLIGAG